MPVYISEWDNTMDEALNKRVLEILHQHYPNHPWAVETKGGLVIIRNMLFGAKWGFCRKFDDIAGDPKVMKQHVINAAGEFLERGRLRRAEWEGERPTVLEGVKKWKAPWVPTDQQVSSVLARMA